MARITHKDAYPLGTEIMNNRLALEGVIIGRRWRLNGELRYYIIDTAEGQFHARHSDLERTDDV